MKITCQSCNQNKHHSVIKYSYTNTGEQIKICMVCCGESEADEQEMIHHYMDEEERNDVYEQDYDCFWEDRQEYFRDEY